MLHLRKSSGKAASVEALNELAHVLSISRRELDLILRQKASLFSHFQIPKPDGQARRIDYPRPKLKIIQRRLLEHLYSTLRIPSYLHGGIPGKTIFTHAQTHTKQKYVTTCDIANFYDSFRTSHIKPVLSQAGFTGPALIAVEELSTLDGHLPHGCPTSCLLANLAFAIVEHEVMKFTKRKGWRYSRYVDDIAISSCNPIKPHFDIVRSAFSRQGFHLAPHKTRHFQAGDRQIVTNLIVNEKLNPTPTYKKQLSQTIRLCLNLGPETIASANGISLRTLKSQLNGQIAHLGRIDKQLSIKYKRRLYGISWKMPAIDDSQKNESAS